MDNEKKPMNQERKQRIINEVTKYLKENNVPPQEIFDILNEVKFRVSAGHGNLNLSSLFDEQINRLKNRQAPDKIIELLIKQRHNVLTQAWGKHWPPDHIPFLPVITQNYLCLNLSVSYIFHEGKAGHNRLDATKLKNKVEAPITPYYIFDVDVGNDMLNMEPAKAADSIFYRKRFGLTCCEIIALGLHTNNILSRCCFNAVGSRYDNGIEIEIPNLLIFKGRAVLDHRYFKGSFKQQHSSPSCAYRL